MRCRTHGRDTQGLLRDAVRAIGNVSVINSSPQKRLCNSTRCSGLRARHNTHSVNRAARLCCGARCACPTDVVGPKVVGVRRMRCPMHTCAQTSAGQRRGAPLERVDAAYSARPHGVTRVRRRRRRRRRWRRAHVPTAPLVWAAARRLFVFVFATTATTTTASTATARKSKCAIW